MAKIRKTKGGRMTSEAMNLQRQVDVLKMENSLMRDAYFQLKATKTKLAESESKYQTLVESANEIVFIAQDNRIKYANKRAFEVFGYTPKEIAKRTLIDFIHPADRILVMGHYKNRLSGNKAPTNYEFRVIDKQKQIRWVLISPVLIQWEGKPAVLTLMTDVSELKQSERSQVEHFRQQKAIAELGVFVIKGVELQALFDEATKMIAETLDVEFCKVLELASDHSFFLLKSGVGWKKGLVGRAKLGIDLDSQAGFTLKSKAPVVVENLSTEKRFHGPKLLSDHHVVSGISIIIGSPEEPFGVLGAHTAHKRLFSQQDIDFLQSIANLLASAILRRKFEDEIKFKNLILSTEQESSIDGILLVDDQGRVISANRPFFDMMGVPKTLRSTKDDRPLLKFVSSQIADPKQFKERILYLYKHRHEIGKDEIFLKNGKVLDRYSAPMFGAAGKYYGRVWYFRDITEQRRTQNELEERDQLFRKLTLNVPGMIFQFLRKPDGDFSVPYTSDAIKDLFGCSPEDVKDDFSPITKAIVPEDLDRVIASIEHSGEHLTPWQFEYRVKLPGRPIKWMFGQSTPQRLPDGSVLWHGFNTDITDRKISEQKIMESEEKFRVLTESATDQIFMVDRHFRYLSVNKSLATDFKTTVSKMVGKTIFDFFPKKTANQLIKNIDSVFKTGQPKTNFEEVIKVLGQDRYISTSLHPITDPHGVVVAVAGISRDNTEFRKTQLNLSKFEMGLQRSSQAIFITDPKGHIEFVNPAFQRIYGYSPKEVLGKTPRIIKSGILSPKQYKDFWKTLLSKKNVEGEIINKTKDGRILNIFGSANPIVDKKGTILGFLGIQSDITQQRKVENALKDQQTQYKTLVESLPACIKLFGADGKLISVNTHGREEHGLQKMSDKEIRNWNFLECVEKEDHDKVKKGMTDALKGKISSFVIHHTHTHARGGSCFSTLVPVRSEGKVKFVLFTSLDVTDQQKMQAALKESEERYRDIVENSTEMIHSVDDKNRILFANKKEYELLGYTPEDLIGMPLSKIYSRDLLRQVEQGFEKLKAEGKLYIPQSQLVKKNGQFLDVEVHSIAIYDKDGKFYRTRSILIDITERRRAEEELKKRVEQMEFIGRTNLKRHAEMLMLEKEVAELKKQLAELKGKQATKE